MTASKHPLMVLGVGNTWLRDDGVGIRVVEALDALVRRDPDVLPPGTRLVDGGILDLELLHLADGSRALLLVDAVDLGWEPGTADVIRGDAILAAGRRVGAAEDGPLGELLAVGRLMGWLPELVSLLGVQVGSIGAGEGLTPAVEAALPRAVAVACREIDALDAAASLTPEPAGVAR